MPKPAEIELSRTDRIAVLYEDRSVLAIDKPPGWLLAPVNWQRTQRNLQAALMSSIAGGAFWARSRRIRYLRFVHRLDGETSGVLLLARSPGALAALSRLFETRQVKKVYLAVSDRTPPRPSWTCNRPLAPDPGHPGRSIVSVQGKPAETDFRVVEEHQHRWLIEARPVTGRTHQIRVHLAQSGCPILGDDLYGGTASEQLGLRAAGLAYRDPFTRKPVWIRAPTDAFLAAHGFGGSAYRVAFDPM